MLHDFLKANRADLIERCRVKVEKRRSPVVTPDELTHGIPLFLDQLTEMLPGGIHAHVSHHPMPDGDDLSYAERRLKESAALHGQELLRHDFTIEQVVHDYGDLCQAITQLAHEKGSVFDAKEFGVLNSRLDNAIAGAVTEFARKSRTNQGESDANMSVVVHELRSLHNNCIVAITALRHGTVGLAGATGAALDVSMIRIGTLLDHAIAMADSTA